jgi:hypothetical protein
MFYIIIHELCRPHKNKLPKYQNAIAFWLFTMSPNARIYEVLRKTEGKIENLFSIFSEGLSKIWAGNNSNFYYSTHSSRLPVVICLSAFGGKPRNASPSSILALFGTERARFQITSFYPKYVS